MAVRISPTVTVPPVTATVSPRTSLNINISHQLTPDSQFRLTFFNSSPLVVFSSENLRCLLSSSTHRVNRKGFVRGCFGSSRELIENDHETLRRNDDEMEMDVQEEEEDEEVGIVGDDKVDIGNQSLWNKMKDIITFTGPATGLWICGPLMSLIDTAVIGQGSSIELAALGPATVVCDNMSYVFMFLSIATSNMVATALARQDRKEVQHHISVLLFVGFACGLLMFLFTRFLGSWTLSAFTGPKNAHIVPAANSYVQIRALAMPAVLVGWVTQSASLGMKDSWGPLKALAVASVINCIGDIVLCSFLGYGIAGAAWATMVSQVVAAYMMIETLNNKGYNACAISIPSPRELLMILELAAPVVLTMISKVAFYTLLTYLATSMGTLTIAAHQAMVQTFCMFAVLGEPLSQTAQSFMPELLYGINRSLEKARGLQKSLTTLGAIIGTVFGIIGTSVPWLLPYIFTPDRTVIKQMHSVLIPYFIALAVTPPIVSLEGTLLAGRDLRFISLSMSGCFSIGALLAWILSSRYGLPGCWYALAGFQWARFLLALQRLLSPKGVLYSEDFRQYEVEKLRTA